MPKYRYALIAAVGLAVAVHAADGTFTNLTTSGVVDFNGQTLAFGAIDATNPAFTLSYASNYINLASPLTSANWAWLQKTSEYQLVLTSTNQLKLYDPTLKTVAITLDPASGSSFAKGLTIGGTLSAQGGLALPTSGTTSAQGLTFGDTNLYRSAAATLKTDKNLLVGQSLSVAGSTLNLGVNATSAGTGLSTTYTDGNPNATVSYAVSRAGAYWKFLQNSTALQMQLDPTNKLTIYNSSAAAKVVLDPVGRSIFNTGLTVAGGLNVTSGAVGIGTSSPERPLHISASNAWLRVDRTDDVYGAAVLLVHKDAAATKVLHTWLVGSPNTSGVSGDDFAIIDNDISVGAAASGARLLVDKDTGNIGLGTTSPQASLDVAGRTVKYSNLAPEYRWEFGGSQDLNWKTIANVNLGTGQWIGVNFVVNVLDAYTNYGSSVDARPLTFYVRMTRSGSVQDDANSAAVSGPFNEYVRVVKTATGVYELQVRQPANSRRISVRSQAYCSTSMGTGGSLVYVTTPVDGSTTGTLYTPGSYHKEYFTGGYFSGNVGLGTTAPSVRLDVAGDAKVSGTVTVKKTIRVPPSGDLSMGTFTTGTNPAQ